MTKVKICGIKTPEALDVVIEEKADFVGFVFFDRSPRAVNAQQAAALIKRMPPSLQSVGLFVDADDEQIASVLAHTTLSFLQLHGQETPERIAHLKSRFKLPIIKALKIADPYDLDPIADYQAVSDWLLFDAKPPRDATLPGGNGAVFDWQLLKNFKAAKPWMLSGGLTVDNLSAALDVLRPDAVDVSSGVENAPGQKDLDKIRSFIRAAKRA